MHPTRRGNKIFQPGAARSNPRSPTSSSRDPPAQASGPAISGGVSRGAAGHLSVEGKPPSARFAVSACSPPRLPGDKERSLRLEKSPRLEKDAFKEAMRQVLRESLHEQMTTQRAVDEALALQTEAILEALHRQTRLLEAATANGVRKAFLAKERAEVDSAGWPTFRKPLAEDEGSEEEAVRRPPSRAGGAHDKGQRAGATAGASWCAQSPQPCGLDRDAMEELEAFAEHAEAPDSPGCDLGSDSAGPHDVQKPALKESGAVSRTTEGFPSELGHSSSIDQMFRKGAIIEMCKGITEDSQHPLLGKIDHFLTWFENVQNPRRHRCIDRIVESHWFHSLIVLVICLNIIFVGADANEQMRNYGENLSPVNSIETYLFACFYVVELLMRMISEGRYFFYGDNMKWNLYDSCVVIASVIVDFSSDGSSKGFLRIARILKVVKVTRMVRILREMGLDDLQMMLRQMSGSLKSLFWCFVMLGFVTYVFGLFFMYSLVDLDHVENQEDRDRIVLYFGSVFQAMITLLMCTSAGTDWGEVFWVLDVAGWFVSLSFLLYILFFVIAVWNIITATFVDKVAVMAKPGNDMLALEARMKDCQESKALSKLLRDMDWDKDHQMDMDELRECLSSRTFQDFLLARGVHIYEVGTLCEMLFESGQIDMLCIDDLVTNVLRIRGQATSLDLHTMRYELTSLMRSQSKRLEQMESQIAKMQARHRRPLGPRVSQAA